MNTLLINKIAELKAERKELIELANIFALDDEQKQAKELRIQASRLLLSIEQYQQYAAQ